MWQYNVMSRQSDIMWDGFERMGLELLIWVVNNSDQNWVVKVYNYIFSIMLRLTLKLWKELRTRVLSTWRRKRSVLPRLFPQIFIHLSHTYFKGLLDKSIKQEAKVGMKSRQNILQSFKFPTPYRRLRDEL